MNRRERIRKHLQSTLSPFHLEVTGESHEHRVPKGAESHFKVVVVVVSEDFAGQRSVARHRMVNKVLHEEFRSGLHALALYTEWFEKGGMAPDSPRCLGGSEKGL